MHGFQAGLQQQLLQERIAHLHVRPLLLGALAELLAGHGGPVDAVASGLGSHVDHRVPLAGGLGVKNLVAPHQPQSKGVHQRVLRIAGLELGFAAQVRHAKTVAVRSYPADHAFQDRMIAMHRGPIRGIRDRPKPQRIHDRQRPCAHGEDVPQDAADAGGRALKRLNERRVVVRLDLEGAGPAVANVDDAGVLARPLHHQLAARGQPLQMHARRFIRTMLAPHHAENAQLSKPRLAPQRGLDPFILFRRNAVLGDDLRRNGGSLCGSGHGVFLFSHLFRNPDPELAKGKDLLRRGGIPTLPTLQGFKFWQCFGSLGDLGNPHPPRGSSPKNKNFANSTRE